MCHSVARAVLLWAGLFLVFQPAAAKTVSWDREENMKQAGRALGQLWAKTNALAIFEHIERCHEEHVLQATEYTPEAEACLTQDVVHSLMSASMYDNMSKVVREASGSPKADTVLRAMKGRLMAAAKTFGFTPEEMEEIAELGFETAEPVYSETLLFETMKEQAAAEQ